MKTIAPADLQRWSDDVARDPASLSFVPLSRAYRKQGRRDLALKLCLRGLEQHPTNVDAHGLLAMLYFESGQRAKAYDEWSMVTQLDPDNFDALRGMGFFHLEQGDDVTALRTLHRASTIRPNDITVQEALKIIRDRNQAQPAAPLPPLPVAELFPWEVPEPPQLSVPPSRPAAPQPDPWAAPDTAIDPWSAPTPPAAATHEPWAAPAPAPSPAFAPASAPAAHAPAGARDIPADPTRLFDPITKGGQILGALLLDAQGLVLAGSLEGETGAKAEALGATLGGAIEEAARTSAHLALGPWKGILLEAEEALLHLAPVREGMIVLIAAKKQTPAGWMLRSAHQAVTLAIRFLEVYA
jgi:predicted regulator of Ras-like GTPase activity (Roadblock/LC7/MglB family)